MAGAQKTINNQLKSATAMATEMAMMTATMIMMDNNQQSTKSSEGNSNGNGNDAKATVVAAEAHQWQQKHGGKAGAATSLAGTTKSSPTISIYFSVCIYEGIFRANDQHLP